MKINGYKRINLNNPEQFKGINLDDKITYNPSNNSKINALVVERGDITVSTVYRHKNSQDQEIINVDICFVDRDEKTNKRVIKTMLYQELFKEDLATKGHYKYLDKKLTQAGIPSEQA